VKEIWYDNFTYGYFYNSDEGDLERDEVEDEVELIPATTFGTFYSAAFCNFACLKFWSKQGHKNKLDIFNISVCELIAKAGSLEDVKWTRCRNLPWDAKTCAAAAAAAGTLRDTPIGGPRIYFLIQHRRRVAYWRRPLATDYTSVTTLTGATTN
jgi:hypothetical protein